MINLEQIKLLEYNFVPNRYEIIYMWLYMVE